MATTKAQTKFDTGNQPELSGFTALCQVLLSIPSVFSPVVFKSALPDSFLHVIKVVSNQDCLKNQGVVQRLPKATHEKLQNSPVVQLKLLMDELSTVQGFGLPKESLISMRASQVQKYPIVNPLSYFPISQFLATNLPQACAIFVRIDWDSTISMQSGLQIIKVLPSVLHHDRLYKQTSMIFTNGVYCVSLIRVHKEWVIHQDLGTRESLSFAQAIKLLTLKNMYPLLVVYNSTDVYQAAHPALTNHIQILKHARTIDTHIKFAKQAHWTCPVCSSPTKQDLHQCQTCKTINWDIFYEQRATAKIAPPQQAPLPRSSPRTKRIVPRPPSTARSIPQKHKSGLFKQTQKESLHKLCKSQSSFQIAIGSSKDAISTRLRVPTTGQTTGRSRTQQKHWECARCLSQNIMSSIICKTCKVAKFQTNMNDVKKRICHRCFHASSSSVCDRCHHDLQKAIIQSQCFNSFQEHEPLYNSGIKTQGYSGWSAFIGNFREVYQTSRTCKRDGETAKLSDQPECQHTEQLQKAFVNRLVDSFRITI